MEMVLPPDFKAFLSLLKTKNIPYLLSQHASPKLCTLVQGFSCYTGILSSHS